jgi:hypothetical protein
MYVEAGGGSVGVFPARSDQEYELAGVLILACLRALIGLDVNEVVIERARAQSDQSAPRRLTLAPETLVKQLIPTGWADWRIVRPEEASGYRLYWDICQHFVTLIGPDDESRSFEDVVCRAVELERSRRDIAVMTNWDVQEGS